jgi:hypothetical protein
MATLGEARFEYTPVGGSLTTHLLRVELQDVEAMDEIGLHEWWSADKSTRFVVKVGSGVRDVWATVRYDDQPTQLKALLRSALWDNVTVTYREESGGTAYPCKVVATEGGGAQIRPDRDAPADFKLWEVRLHLRATTGSFDALL